MIESKPTRKDQERWNQEARDAKLDEALHAVEVQAAGIRRFNASLNDKALWQREAEANRRIVAGGMMPQFPFTLQLPTIPRKPIASAAICPACEAGDHENSWICERDYKCGCPCHTRTARRTA